MDHKLKSLADLLVQVLIRELRDESLADSSPQAAKLKQAVEPVAEALP